MQIRAIGCTMFGYEDLIGVRVIPNPHAYFMNEEMLRQRTRIRSAPVALSYECF